MRIDTRLDREGLTVRQLFFIECWANLSHKNSIDTDRVGFNNILNSLQEIDFLYEFGNKYGGEKKRERAVSEFLEILIQDELLNDSIFLNLNMEIISLFTKPGLIKDPNKSPVEKQKKLFQSLCKQLRLIIENDYVDLAADKIKSIVDKSETPSDDELMKLYNQINNLMSVLLTKGMPLTECYLLYNNILLKNDKGDFDERYQSWRNKISQNPSTHTVTFILENDVLHDLLSGNDQPIAFNDCQFKIIDTENGKKYIQVKINTKAITQLSARMKADQILVESLDVIAYMIGKGKIEIKNKFSVKTEGEDINIINHFDNEINVNSDRLTKDEFTHFIKSMDVLFKNATVESRKKISSAFHFLRNGINNISKESKFTSYWSALESLTLGVSQDEIKHDEHVILSVVPCIGLDYVVKQMFALRGIINYLNIESFSDDEQIHDFINITLGDLYLLLKNDNVCNYLTQQMLKYPYALFALNKMINLCKNPSSMGAKIDSHTKKVTLHIHRLYILRNSIVHNAESNPNITFLTSNLEHYLRGTINAMYYIALLLPGVSSPEEIFVRCNFLFKSIQDNLVRVNSEGGPCDNDLVEWLNLHK
ncbi:hypothetical protein [Pectobacterium brasiliense]|uniref:hypothetical protein n=1 Tax=Pectobacterium brasiliense TaxID=180957 RepID=UPI000C1C757D|nr:hypothetical protein [Pectobacterium brasiliense]ATV43087.1 hypothetical protein CTV95_06255 [Pectobacterium brasiliense]MCA6981353.1 hypothetical protein [Pectobacterium brasiliense]MCH4990915.1 hypothetical protein [Pectobacterium brasiliense]